MRIGSKDFEIAKPIGRNLGEAISGLRLGKNKIVREAAVKRADGIPIDEFISDELIKDIERAYKGAKTSIKVATVKPQEVVSTRGNRENSIRKLFLSTLDKANSIYEQNWEVFARTRFPENPKEAAKQTLIRTAKLAEIERAKQELINSKPQTVINTPESVINTAIELKNRQIIKLRQILVGLPEQVKIYTEQLKRRAQEKEYAGSLEFLEEATQTIENRYKIPQGGGKVIIPENPEHFKEAKVRRIGKRSPAVTNLSDYREKHPSAVEKRKGIQIAAEYERLIQHEEAIQEARAMVRGKTTSVSSVMENAEKQRRKFEDQIDDIRSKIRLKVEQFLLERSFLEEAKTNLTK